MSAYLFGFRVRSCLHTLRTRSARRAALFLACASALAACGGGSAGGGAPLRPGSEVAKPGGGTFFVDPVEGGHGLHLVEMYWGRLVDVHALDAAGEVEPEPAFRDLVIAERVQSEPQRYRLETNPLTLATRLVVLRRRGAPDAGGGTFDDLLRGATRDLAPVRPRADRGPDPLLSFVARNAVLMLRFDDALDDGAAAWRALAETVRISTGEPPELPFGARPLFDPNHGTLVGHEFHSTRVLLDLTVSAAESAELPVPVPLDALGLPPSQPSSAAANVALRLPTRTDFGTGQFELLHALSGATLDESGNGPMDATRPTHDVVRGLRSGNGEDANHGFLLDLNRPALVAAWPLRIEGAREDPAGRAGFDFLLEAAFTGACRAAPRAGDVLQLGAEVLEVARAAPAPDAEGRLRELSVRRLSRAPLGSAAQLLGEASFLSTLRAASTVAAGCWLRFSPAPLEPPVAGVAPAVEVRARFSEPMDPASLSPFDDFVLVRGETSTVPTPHNRVVGEVVEALDGCEFTFRPTLPLAHDTATADAYHVRLGRPTDLAGNALADVLPAVSFTLDARADAQRSLATSLRFTGVDELEPLGRPDFRGAFLLDPIGERIRPRPVAFAAYPADRSHPVPLLMTVGPLPVQTPFSPLGSKLQTLWRYCDLGWQVLDESKYDLDVVGLSWAPFGGRVIDDFFERFEIRLGHSRLLPDEALDAGALPAHPSSGLNARQSDFDSNLLADERSPQKVVHPRELGYRIRGADLFTTAGGTVLLPFPLNRGASTPVAYTWRDTALGARGAPGGAGIPLDIEAGAPLQLEAHPGYVARAGAVPSIGLPLLMEFRCFPSVSAIGLNGCDVSLAVNSSALPSFRSYSSGGTNTAGLAVRRDPDLEAQPRGGFNPSTSPPGQATPRGSDNTFYVGQLDVVTRVTRVHTVWLDTQVAAPDFCAPVVSPRADEQPSGTRVLLEYRGAHGFELADLDAVLGRRVDEAQFPFDAEHLDAYGDIFAILPESQGPGELVDTRERLGSDAFPGAVHDVAGGEWTADIDALDGARYLQLRITFLGNVGTLQHAELSAIGLAYGER